MALKTIVKVGNVTNLTDARYAAGMEVDYVGFPLDGDDAVDYETFLAITGWIEGVKIIGEFSGSDANAIKESIKRFNLDIVQIEDITLLDQIKEAKTIVLKLSQEQLQSQFDQVIHAANNIAALIIEDDKDELSPLSFELVAKLNDKVKSYLGSGITVDNASDVITLPGVAGICLRGSEELRPGFKDMDQLADILEELEVIDY